MLILVLLNPDMPCFANRVDPDQLASKKPNDLDLHCLPFSMWININNLDQVIWLAENLKWAWHLYSAWQSLIFFSFLLENTCCDICCSYSLKVLWQALLMSTENMFLCRNMKKVSWIFALYGELCHKVQLIFFNPLIFFAAQKLLTIIIVVLNNIIKLAMLWHKWIKIFIKDCKQFSILQLNTFILSIQIFECLTILVLTFKCQVYFLVTWRQKITKIRAQLFKT